MNKVIIPLIFTVLLLPLLIPLGKVEAITPPVPPNTPTILEQCYITHDITGYLGADGTACDAVGTNSTDAVCCTLELMAKVTDWVFAAVMILSIIFIILGAFYFVTAGGDPARVKTGKDFVLYAIIGFTLAILAVGIVELIKGIVAP